MRPIVIRAVAGAIATMAALSAAMPATGSTAARPAASASPALTVLTYNVEGLPFPVRTGRSAKVAEIATTLRSLRAQGRQPHVIVLQEAFTAAAKAIAPEAGYRYFADGPGRDDAGMPARNIDDRAFARAASLLHGERSGKWVDSGLRIASDFPIVAVRRMPFPAFACAGFDCLANKGALAVLVRVPGADQPVAVLATHLNSRFAAHVSFARSLYAYRRQVDALGGFIRAVVPSSAPMVIAGDFNAGQHIDRRGYLIREAAFWHGAAAPHVAMDECINRIGCTKAGRADLGFSYRRGRDWQFFSPGRASTLGLAGLSTLFGHDRHGAMLSDHVGYVAAYTFVSRLVPPRPPLELAER